MRLGETKCWSGDVFWRLIANEVERLGEVPVIRKNRILDIGFLHFNSV